MNVPETFFSVGEELQLLLLSCVAGAVFGVYYDVFRALRLTFRHNGFFVFLEDLIFLGTYALFLPAFASAAARGELRGYYILGGIIGFTLYFFTVGKAVIRLIERLILGMKTVFSIAVKPFRYAAVKFVGYSKKIVKSYKNSRLPLQNKPRL